MKKIIVIAGPTASGKSALALELARIFGGEIVSADSMQIYKYLDIGTAKPTNDELDTVPHHMVDVVDPREKNAYSCADFARDAKVIIDDILARGRVPILCGGTGLYIDTVLKGTEFSEGDTDFAYRDELFEIAREKGNEHVHEMLREVDPDSAEATHPNNLKRVIRALEIHHTTGITKTEWDKRSHEKPAEFEASFIALSYREREKLYERINRRVDIMLERGLLDEVESLLKEGYLIKDTTAAQAIGYKELIAYFDGSSSLEDAIEDIKRESRRYAKRQLTWFSRNDKINWLYPDEAGTFKIIVNNAVEILKKDGFRVIMDE